MVGRDSSRQHRKQAPLGLHFKKVIILLTEKISKAFVVVYSPVAAEFP